jgi:hypothetical protein
MALSEHLPVRTKPNEQDPQSGQSASGPTMKL